MSSKSEVVRRLFHAACVKAVGASLGPNWQKIRPGVESWRCTFQNNAGEIPRFLRLHLHQPTHRVAIVLAVTQDIAGPFPHIWWEDRTLHTDATGLAKVLWCGELTYGVEESIAVPREPWNPAFEPAIRQKLKDVVARMDSWYSAAENHLLAEGT